MIVSYCQTGHAEIAGDLHFVVDNKWLSIRGSRAGSPIDSTVYSNVITKGYRVVSPASGCVVNNGTVKKGNTTLILAARHDPITPMEIQEIMLNRIPHAELKVFDGVGHNMKVEIPDLLAAAVLSFVQKLDTSGALQK